MKKIIYYKNRYYALDVYRQRYTVYVFDESGKFLFRIGKYGQGPGEYYVFLDDMLINPFTGNIDLLSAWGLIFTYDLSGKHVKTSLQFTNSSDDFVFHAAYYFIALDEKTYVFYSPFDQYRIFYYDMNEMKIIRQEFEEKSFTRLITSFYEYRGQWYFYRSYSSETYEILPDSLDYAYSWDFGKFNYDIKKISENSAHNQETDNRLPYRFQLQGQNNLYVIAEIRIKNDVPAYLIYNKSTHTCTFIQRFKESVNFRPNVVTNEYVLSFCRHGELSNFVTDEMLDESNRQKLEILRNEKDEMNPTIIKYYFK